jgi:tRNA (cytidine/uridine-2'-O-)-methyltransferase
MRVCLYQPEIPQNTGTILRMAACFGVGVDIVQPCGFIISDRRLRRAAMDYADKVEFEIHESWQSYLKTNFERLVLLDTSATTKYTDYTYHSNDTLVLGQESSGVPDSVKQQVTDRVYIPMQAGFRSLNVAISSAIVLGEALRQQNFVP